MGWEVMLRAVLSLLLVFGLIAGAGLLVRRFGGRVATLGRRSGPRRLALMEQLILDNRRRLVLVRQDSAEHLLLLGPGGDLLVSSGVAAQEPFRLTEPPAGEPS
jgi:flagellar biogenesis protein FliO